MLDHAAFAHVYARQRGALCMYWYRIDVSGRGRGSSAHAADLGNELEEATSDASENAE